MFRALRLDKSDGEFQREFVTLDEGDLPTVGDSDHPELVVDVEYSPVNDHAAYQVNIPDSRGQEYFPQNVILVLGIP